MRGHDRATARRQSRPRLVQLQSSAPASWAVPGQFLPLSFHPRLPNITFPRQHFHVLHTPFPHIDEIDDINIELIIDPKIEHTSNTIKIPHPERSHGLHPADGHLGRIIPDQTPNARKGGTVLLQGTFCSDDLCEVAPGISAREQIPGAF